VTAPWSDVTRYPVYVISKGRADRCLTSRFLRRDGVPHCVVVEPQEADAYRKTVGDDNLVAVLELPFSNLGLGGIPARNWVWEHAKAAGTARHWILDDNIMGCWRRHERVKIRAAAGPVFRACEAFVDRYTNVAIAGLNYYMFAPNGTPMPPFVLNVHVYSFLLIDNALPYRWRGRYNEDTDLCLQVLAGGLCTVLFNAFLAWKQTTMKMKGGNTDVLYQGDGRLRMARSLERMWPHVVDVDRRFRRPQHVVRDSWRKFDQPLIRRADFDPAALPAVDDFGLRLEQVKDEVKSPLLRDMLERDRAARGIVRDCPLRDNCAGCQACFDDGADEPGPQPVHAIDCDMDESCTCGAGA
jgi:hypothetical protein